MTTTKHLPRIVVFTATALLFFATPDRARSDDSMRVDPSGDVGIGTNTPAAALHVFRSNSDSTLRMESAGPGAVDNALLHVLTTGGGQPGFVFQHGVSGNRWDFRAGGAGNAILNANTGAVEFTFFSSGNLLMTGTLTTGGPSCSGGCDEVFHPGYEIAPIEEHAAAMWGKSYLPAVGPTNRNEPINLTEKMGGMLNELEKAHIYIERLNEQLKATQEEASQKDVLIAGLEQRLARLESLLTENRAAR